MFQGWFITKCSCLELYLVTGDVILQNGANSGVGQSVIQLAASWRIISVNIVRDR